MFLTILFGTGPTHVGYGLLIAHRAKQTTTIFFFLNPVSGGRGMESYCSSSSNEPQNFLRKLPGALLRTVARVWSLGHNRHLYLSKEEGACEWIVLTFRTLKTLTIHSLPSWGTPGVVGRGGGASAM